MPKFEDSHSAKMSDFEDDDNPIAEYDQILGGNFAEPQIEESDHEEDPEALLKPIWKPELKKVVQMTDEDGKQHLLGFENYKPTRNAQKRKDNAPKKEPFRDSAMLLKAVVAQNNFWGSSIDLRLEIQSENLQNVFREHARRHRELNLDVSPIVIEYPFRCLFFLRSKLHELYDKRLTSSETRKELTPLLSFIEEPLGVQKHIEVYDDLVIKQKQITFRMMWSIFPPFTPVIMADLHDVDGVGGGYLLESISLKHGDGMPQWELSLLHGHHYGGGFSIRRSTHAIEYFNGKRDINLQQLAVVPLHLVEEQQRIRIKQALIERGKKYVEYSQAENTFLHYSGPVRLQSEDTNARLGAWGSTGTLEINERIVLDRTAQYKVEGGYTDDYGSHRASCLQEYFASATGGEKSTTNMAPAVFDNVTLADLARLGKNKGIQVDTQVKLGEGGMLDTAALSGVRKWEFTEEDYFICQSTTVGFAMDQKAWVYKVRISLLKPIQWHGDPFSSLQFTPEAKRLVERLVKGFTNRAEDVYDDIIKDKGKGLIFLLHGPPGLGKTLTAESVAESARRPLYRVTTGALSTNVATLEKQLSDIFRLGARWRAVVLLDEADVLMSKRTITDLTRNAIVAVFLRLLEYYRGMLFLTTNRHEDFDEAFHSRIHLTLEYNALTPDWRQNIWREHIGRASARNKNKNLWNDQMYTALAEIDTNGRDIKNYARTSFAFAQAEEEDLTLQHLLIVLVNNLPEKKKKKHEGTFKRLRALEKELLEELEFLAKEKAKTEAEAEADPSSSGEVEQTAQ